MPKVKSPKGLPKNYAELAGKSDEIMVERTGKTWPEWVALLDAAGGRDLKHGELAKLAYEATSLGWWSQTIAVGYERIRGLRAVGETANGFTANKSKTFDAKQEALYDAFAEKKQRRRWLDVDVELRTSTPPRLLRATWPDGSTVVVSIEPKGSKAVVTIQHEKLPSAEAREAMKALWTEKLAALQAHVGAR